MAEDYIISAAEDAFPDFPLDNQGKGPRPNKGAIRRLFWLIQNLLDALGLSVTATYVRGTKAQLDSVSGAANGEVGLVIADANENLRGVYVREGGAWVKKSDLPADAAQVVLDQVKDLRDIVIDFTADAFDAREGAEAARDMAAGYASDAVSQGNVPIYATVAGMSALTIPAGISTIRVNGFGAANDGRGGRYVRVPAQPSGTEFDALAFRTNDRFLPPSIGGSSPANGGWWAYNEPYSMKHECSRMAARLAAQRNVLIACYGDSTTDGNATTDWVQNAVDSNGDAVGATDHYGEAPNAWPQGFRWVLINHYRDGLNLRMLNCGYSGRKISDGWALRNFPVAVMQNAMTIAGRFPDAVIIDFGLNDENDPNDYLLPFIQQHRALCRLAMANGIVPMLKSCDPNWRNGVTLRDGEKNMEILDTAKKALAQEMGVPFLDSAEDIRRFVARNKDWHTQPSMQPDGLHGADRFARFKGGALAKFFMRNFVERKGADGPQRISSFDSAMSVYLNENNAFLFKQSKDGGVHWSGASAGVVVPVDKLAMDVMVWNEDPDAELIYRGWANENVLAATQTNYQRPSHSIYDFVNNTTRSLRTPAGIGFIRGSDSFFADVPYRVGKLAYGWNRVRCNTGNSPYFVCGHYEIRSTPEMVKVITTLPEKNGILLNALAETGPFQQEFPRDTSGRYVALIPEAMNGGNLVGMMGSDYVDLFLHAAIPGGTGVVIGWCKAYGTVTAPGGYDDVYFYALYRSGTAVSLYRGTQKLNFSTGVTSVEWTPLANGTVTQTADAQGGERYRIKIDRAGDVQRVRIYEGWDFPGSLAVSHDTNPGGVPLPAGFAMGGLFANVVTPVAGAVFNPIIFSFFGKQKTSNGFFEPVLP